MNLPLTILEFVLLFGLLVFLHEFGHFIMARLFKIEVEEFGFGFPPRLVKLFTWQGTDFTLNWIPFGGFVRPKGENDPEVPGGLSAASPIARLSVLLGGPVMNLLTGILLFSFIFTMSGDPTPRTVDIASVSPESPAESAGLLPGDIIVEINGERIEGQDELRSIIQANLDQEVTLVYQRGTTEQTVTIVPRSQPPQGQGALGIAMLSPKLSFFDALPYGFELTGEQTKQLFLMPARLIRGQVSAEDARVVGPKGMFDIFRQARERDIQENQAATAAAAPVPQSANTLFLIATISVALGLTNLLPIPALDGGRILFVLPELILRKRIPQQYENIIHLVGFVSLIALMIYVTTQDIINPIVLPK